MSACNHDGCPTRSGDSDPNPADPNPADPNPADWAHTLGISREAVELYLASDVIDLHVDSFIWTRLAGYDVTKLHGRGVLGARFCSQADLPRLRTARVHGAVWVVTTNPIASPEERADALPRDLMRLRALLSSKPARARVVCDPDDFQDARRAGLHAAWLGIQGGDALLPCRAAVEAFGARLLVLVTLVHLTPSTVAGTSSPLRLGRADGLSMAGRELVHWLDAQRIFVDLAHIHPRGFWDAVGEHDRSRPLLVSHTAMMGVHRHWRNLDDAQLRAVADSGGTVGILYDSRFLGDRLLSGRAARVVDHLEYAVRTVGDDFVSLGSDWDGAILTPRDMPTCLELPRLVELMLQRGLRPEQIRKILGANFLRALSQLRGQSSSRSNSSSPSADSPSRAPDSVTAKS